MCQGAEHLRQPRHASTKDAGSASPPMLRDPRGATPEGASPSAPGEQGASSPISMETRAERRGRLEFEALIWLRPWEQSAGDELH